MSGRAYTATKPRRGTLASVPYAFVEDVAASWEQYDRFASALAGVAPPGLIVHAAGPTDEGFRIIAVWESEEAWQRFRSERIPTKHTHGTGCTLASAIATSLAQGMQVEEAVVRARDYVRRAIESAPGYGRGHGPINHAHTVEFAMGLAAAAAPTRKMAKAPAKKRRPARKAAPKRRVKAKRKRT